MELEKVEVVPTNKPNDTNPDTEQTIKLRVQNICCGKEATLVKDTLNGLDGIVSVHVNVIGRLAHIRHKPAILPATDIVKKLNDLHLGISIMESGQDTKETDEKTMLRLKLQFASVVIQAILFISLIIAKVKQTNWEQWVSIPILLLGGLPMLWKAAVQIKQCVIANVNLLMLIAVGGTIALMEWLDACLIVFVFSIADLLLQICYHKVQKSISELLVSAPETVVLAETNEVVKVEDVAVGTLILVCAGEQIPLDGTVVKGNASVDESSMTGESTPVQKLVDDVVYSGTIIQSGFLKIKTTCDYQSSTLSRVSQYIEEAQARGSTSEEILNKFAKYYTPVIVGVSLLFVIVPLFLYKFQDSFTKNDFDVWTLRSLKILVVACPCSLIVAVPVTMISGISNAAKNGLLVKGAEYLETMAKVKLICFDKTGTLTEGRFQVVNEYAVDDSSKSESVALAAALETKSSHPVAAAIVNHYSGCITDKITEFGAQISLPDVTKFKNESGMGLSGIVTERHVLVGNLALLETYNVEVDEMHKQYLKNWSKDGCTVVFIAVDDQLKLILGLADKIRDSSRNAIEQLNGLNIETVMLTGDHSGPASLVSKHAGLKTFHCSMKPHEKYEWLVGRQTYDKKCVAMVGDGVNDCPSLAASDVGIAIGPTATGLAVSSAGLTLMSDSLEKITFFYKLSKMCRYIVFQNIIGSLLIKIIFVAAALSTRDMLWLAVVADVSGLLFVILNGIRPLYFRYVAPKSNPKSHGEPVCSSKTQQQSAVVFSKDESSAVLVNERSHILNVRV